MTRDANVAIGALRIARSLGQELESPCPRPDAHHRVDRPDELRVQLRHLSIHRLLERCATLRSAERRDVALATTRTLRRPAQRAIDLEDEVKEIDRVLKPLLNVITPDLLAMKGVGTDVGRVITVAVGDNPGPLQSVATFARLCGVTPTDASSGKNERHRLNRGGD